MMKTSAFTLKVFENHRKSLILEHGERSELFTFWVEES